MHSGEASKIIVSGRQGVIFFKSLIQLLEFRSKMNQVVTLYSNEKENYNK
jgi:hypothetical protein